MTNVWVYLPGVERPLFYANAYVLYPNDDEFTILSLQDNQGGKVPQLLARIWGKRAVVVQQEIPEKPSLLDGTGKVL